MISHPIREEEDQIGDALLGFKQMGWPLGTLGVLYYLVARTAPIETATPPRRLRYSTVRPALLCSAPLVKLPPLLQLPVQGSASSRCCPSASMATSVGLPCMCVMCASHCQRKGSDGAATDAGVGATATCGPCSFLLLPIQPFLPLPFLILKQFILFVSWEFVEDELELRICRAIRFIYCLYVLEIYRMIRRTTRVE
jgi:hypothetical protein